MEICPLTLTPPRSLAILNEVVAAVSRRRTPSPPKPSPASLMTMIPRRTTILNRHFRKLKWSKSQSLLSLMMDWMKNLERFLANSVSVKLLLLRIVVTRMSLPKMQPQPRRLTQTQKRKNMITHKKREACQTRRRSYNGG